MGTFDTMQKILIFSVYVTNRKKNKKINITLFTLDGVYNQRLVEPSKKLKQLIQIEVIIVKNPNWPEANHLVIYNRGRGFDLP